MAEDPRSTGIALKILATLPLMFYGLAALIGVVCRSWAIGAAGIVFVAFAIWLEDTYAVLTALVIGSVIFFLRVVMWWEDRGRVERVSVGEPGPGGGLSRESSPERRERVDWTSRP